MGQVWNRAGNDTLTGTEDWDNFTTPSSIDYLSSGRDDNDVIQGLGGWDSFQLSAGRDSFAGGDGNDLITAPEDCGFEFGATPGGWRADYADPQITVDLGAGTYRMVHAPTGVWLRTAWGVDAPVLTDLVFSGTFSDIEGIVGRDFGETLRGGGRGYLDEFTGRRAEFFMPSGGNDSIDGRGGFDILSYSDEYENVSGEPLRMQGIRVHFARNEVEDGRGGLDRFTGIELVEGSAFNDTFHGSDGDDFMSNGTGGEDRFFGGRGHDTVEFVHFGLLRGMIVDLERGTGHSEFGDQHRFRGIEGLEGTGLADSFHGADSDDRLRGYEGDDILSGGEGNDTLDGGDGNDLLTGGAGNDRFLLDPALNGMDRIADFEFGKDVLVIVPPGKGNPTQINIGGIEALMNTVGPDIVVSTPGGSPFLTLDDGVASLLAYFESSLVETTDKNIGTEGDDVIKGTPGADKLVALGGNDRVSGLAGADDISGGDGRDSLSGGGGNDAITGDAGNDSLYGDGGADRLNGGTGDDILSGGDGDDILVGGLGADRLSGGNGRDTFVLVNDSRSLSGIDEVLGFNLRDDVLDLSGFAQAGIVPQRAGLSAVAVEGQPWRFLLSLDDPLSSRDILVGVVALDRRQVVTEAEFLDRARFVFRDGEAPIQADSLGGVLAGTNRANHLIGSALTDVLRGLGNSDLIEGMNGADTAFGGDGDDRLSGGRGNDRLRGENGNDRLEGGDGDDVLDGGNGDDVLIAGDGADLLRGGAGKDVLIATDGRNTLFGGGGEDTFILNADALREGLTILGDFDPAEDRLLMDDAADLGNALLTITNDRVVIGDITGDGSGSLEFNAWPSILSDFS